MQKSRFFPRALLLYFLVMVVSFSAASAESPHSRPIKIGILAPLTGDFSVFGNKTLSGVRLAIDEFDPKLISVVVDDVGSETSARVATAASKMISVDKVDILLGLIYVDQTMIVAPLAEKAGIPFFSASLCSSRFKQFHHFACGYSSTDEQLAPLVPLLRKLAVRRLAVLAENSEYALEADEVLRKSIKGTEFNVVATERVNPGERDFRSVLPRLEAGKPDGIFAVTADPSQSFLFFKLLFERHYTGRRIGYLDIDPKYIEEFGKTIEGVYLPGFINPNYSPAFMQRYRSKYHQEPDMYGALGYDQFRIMGKALTDSPLLKDGDIFDRIIGYQYQDPAIRGYRYRPDGTISLPLSVYIVKNGQFVPTE